MSYRLTMLAALLAFAGCNKNQDAAPEKGAEKPAAKAAEKPAEKAAEKPAEKAAEKPATKTADAPKPTEQAKPAEAPKPPAGQPVKYAGAHVLIAYKGAQRAKPTITRSKEEALAKAKEIEAKAKAGEDFAKLAADNSDGPSATRGGSLGTWVKGRMVPAFDEAIGKMNVGDVSGPIETGFGYHIIKRQDLPPQYAGSHILVAYKGSARAKPTITRSKEEALEKAKKLAVDARANPVGFAELAKANSDGPSAPRGGSLGQWAKGQMVPAFDTAIEGMKVGDISDPVETPFGYHVIMRNQAK